MFGKTTDANTASAPSTGISNAEESLRKELGYYQDTAKEMLDHAFDAAQQADIGTEGALEKQNTCLLSALAHTNYALLLRAQIAELK